MKKGEESRQRLIECAAELFWKNGYSATGISEILKQTDLPKGSFYFYFKSKDDLATAVTEYYQKILLEQFQNSSQGNDWESFIEEIFDFLSERTNGQTFAGCPYAVMGMETALSKPAVASVFMEGLKKFEQIFQEVLLCSGLSPDHAKILSQRMLSIYQGYFLLGRISDDTSYLKNAKKIWLKCTGNIGHFMESERGTSVQCCKALPLPDSIQISLPFSLFSLHLYVHIPYTAPPFLHEKSS